MQKDTVTNLMISLSLKREMVKFSKPAITSVVVEPEDDFEFSVSAHFTMHVSDAIAFENYRVLNFLVMDQVAKNYNLIEQLSYSGIKDFCEENDYELEIDDSEPLICQDQVDYFVSADPESGEILFVVELNVGS